jgi:hypothetical protein
MLSIRLDDTEIQVQTKLQDILKAIKAVVDGPRDIGVNSIYCSITVNHRLTGPGKMVKALPAVHGEISNTEI